jgi:hypothetical protein
MDSTNGERLVYVFLVLVTFVIGNVFPYGGAVLDGTIAAVGSSVAWALSATFKRTEVAAGPNLAAALLAAMATGFYTQNPATS